MLANKLDIYKGKENAYMEDNIWEIQELFKDKESKKERGHIEEEEVIVVKLYKVSKSSSLTTLTTSFIMEEVKNLLKYMKFIQSLTQTWLFQPPPHYQSLKSRGEVVMAFVDQKHNTKTARNSYPIIMF